MEDMRKSRRSEPPAVNTAVGAGVRGLLAAEHEDDPFGVAGAWAVPPEYAPPPPPAPEFHIPPPDWDLEEQERLEREKADKLEAAHRILAEEIAREGT